eukprot:TRINITY_DN1882_c0_g1_i3.p1 TRINITY_DN1882_c0_g1~~TRINITY_DN1882_c0_g1_i3.p1  ORF type:complete len:289 (+),score=68.81 TRINITY_DN1882_c0_g1_i3:473-1339(+)
MAYGQASGGKTYTMLGNYGDEYAEAERGIIPRVCDELFTKVQQRREYEAAKKDPKKRWKLSVTVSFVEIYCEKVRNLLEAPHSDAARDVHRMCTIRGGGSASGPFVEGMAEAVECWDDCDKLLRAGARNRATDVTATDGAYSHAVFSVALVQTREDPGTGREDGSETVTGRINLVDLAACSRPRRSVSARASTTANMSLSALRKVTQGFMERQWPAPLPPAMNGNPYVLPQHSVLTRLLDLGRAYASKLVCIATLSPSSAFHDDTLRTLEWGARMVSYRRELIAPSRR